MSIYDTSKIKPNDPLREKKIEILARIKKGFEDLRKTNEGNNFISTTELKDEIIEKYIPIIIKKYVGYPNENGNLINQIINSSIKRKISNMEDEINEMLKEEGRLLSKELKNVWFKVDSMTINEDRMEVFGWKNDKKLEKFKENLVNFDKVTKEINDNSWFKKTAISMLRDNLLARIKDLELEISLERNKRGSEKWKEDQLTQENAKAGHILHDLQNCEFCWNSHVKRVVVKESGHVITNAVAAFRQRLEREIDDLNDELLSFGQKKADLLRKLEETFENGIKKVESAQPSASTTNDKVSENSDNETDSDTSDDYSEVSSIFDEYNEDEVKGEAENTDNSSVGSADNNKPKYDNLKEGHEDPKFIEGSRESNVKYVMNLLNKEPVVKEEDLEVENRNWVEQMKATDSWNKMNAIRARVSIDIREKRKIKKQNVDLDAILEETVDARNFDNHFQTIQRSLGEAELQVKAERAKKKLIDNDPELYFNHFNDWVKKEEEALELEAENKELAAELESISEIKYNEEEKQFLAGEITERQKQEEIAQQIEEKLNVKKKTWSLWKWIKAQAKWVKTKARLLKKNNKIGFEKKVEQIKQEIKKAENNSNLHVQQAFKHAKNKAEALLRDLESIASDNSNTAKNNNFPTSWVVGIGAVLTLILVAVLITKKRKKINRFK